MKNSTRLRVFAGMLLAVLALNYAVSFAARPGGDSGVGPKPVQSAQK